jgi:hypothetical protein
MKLRVSYSFVRVGVQAAVCLFIVALSAGSALAKGKKNTAPSWYRPGATLGQMLVDSKIELSRVTRQAWSKAGFEQKPGQTFPDFLNLPRLWSSREITRENRERTYEFPVGKARVIYVGGIDRFVGRLFDHKGNRKYWAVDAKGKRTFLNHLDLKSGVVVKTVKRMRRWLDVTECRFNLPAGTVKFVIEKLPVCDLWAMGWVDDQSRVELVSESMQHYSKLGGMIEQITRSDPKLRSARDRDREINRAKICAGLWEGYAEAARRYYWDLPSARQKKIDAMFPDRSKIDRTAFLKIRDQYVRYYTVLVPMIRNYADVRLGGQIKDFKTLIAATDGIPRSKALIPQFDKLAEKGVELEKAIRESRIDDFVQVEELIAELGDLKKTFKLECKIKLARLTLEYVQKSKPLGEAAKRLEKLTAQVARAKPAEFDELLEKVSTLRREILFQHPDLQFEKLLICKNPPPGPGHMCDQYLGRHARKGKGLFVLENWQTDKPTETNITKSLPEGYYHHPDLSYDASRVAFAFCDTTVSGNQKRHWIYEAKMDGSSVRQLTGTLKDPMDRVDGRKTVVIEDWDPCYLPDGGLAFISSRNQSYGRCHGGRYVPAFLMYRMNADGSGIRRLSFGEANEWDPAVLNDGRIVYTRWDYINRHDTRFQSLWTTNPDGTRTAHYYGNYSPSPCMIADTQSIPGTNKVVSTAMAHHGYTHGSIIIVDVSKGEDGLDPLTVLTPEIAFPEARYDAMTWMTKAPVPVFEASNTAGLKTRATAMAPYPINDTLFLCSYAKSGRGYRTYLIDTMGGRELIYGAEEVSAAMPVRPRKVPRVIPSVLPENPKENMGTLVVQDVYINRHVNEKHPIAKGSIKSMRVNLIMTQPTRSHWTRGEVSNEVIKRPLGTAPVNPDGSVALSAPAGVPLQLQALDENGMAVMTMRSFIYLQPGETQTCVGCHENRASSPPNIIKTRVKVNPLKPVPGVDYDDMAFSFTRTVQPVLDRYCIGCHGLGGKNEKGKTPSKSYVFSVVLDESLGTKQFDARPASYRALAKSIGTRLAHRNGETFISVARDYFSHTSKLPKMLLDGHNGVKLDRDSFERIVTWLDLNSQCYGTYLPNRIEQRKPSPSGQAALKAYAKELFGAKLASQPLGALVNPADLQESRILLGPLPKSKGGWGTIDNGYDSTKDKRYAKMLKLAEGAYEPMEFRNINGTCGRPKCICGNCWIREMVDAGTYKKQLKAKLAGGK